MAKTSKKKSYTEDVVLNKILSDIAAENLENPTSSHEAHKQNSYEDDLISHYREQDALELRQKYINIAKIIVVFFIMILTILLLTLNNDTPAAIKPEVKKRLTPVPTPETKVIETPKPVQVDSPKTEMKESVSVKTELKTPVAPPPQKPVKTERQIAKEKLLEQMKN